MELKPLNISVLHVAPGAVKSNIATNGVSRFNLQPGTLYADFAAMVHKRIASSQGSNSIPSQVFAQKVVASALRKSPPRYMTLGGNATLFKIFKWLPRGFVLYLMWRNYSKRG